MRLEKGITAIIMKTSQPILSVISAFTLIDMFSCGTAPCSDGFLDSLGIRDIEIVIGTSDLRNQSVYELMNIPSSGRRKRGEKPPVYSGYTPYFEIIQDEVFITNCPPIEKTEVIDMVIELNGPECIFSVNFTVSLSEPEVSISDSYSVVVDSSVGELDVQEFILTNEGPCTNFMCSVTCINELKEFWIGNGTCIIRTSAVNIIFDFIYELSLICHDSDSEDGTNKTSTTHVEFSFMNSSPLTSGYYSLPSSSFSPATVILSQTTTAVNSGATSALYNLSSPPVCLLIAIIVILQSD